MGRTGAKKLAKKVVDKTQYCIDGVLVNEVLDGLPTKGVKIIGATVDINHYSQRKRLPIPNKLKRLGLSLYSQREVDVRAAITFDETTADVIKRNVRLICNALGADPAKATFHYLTLQNGTSAGKFIRTKKDITPSDNDLRKKTNVLGLVDAQGDVASLIRGVSADAYTCNIQTVETRVVICNKN
jgi:hypothetical protein